MFSRISKAFIPKTVFRSGRSCFDLPRHQIPKRMFSINNPDVYTYACVGLSMFCGIGGYCVGYYKQALGTLKQENIKTIVEPKEICTLQDRKDDIKPNTIVEPKEICTLQEEETELVYNENDDIQTKIDIKLVQGDVDSFRDIKNKTEQICLYVIKRKPGLIGLIENPSYKVCIAALNQNINYFQYIKNVPKEVCIKVLEKDGLQIKHIPKPDEQMCFTAIRQNPNSIRLIQYSATKEMELEALTLGAKKISYYQSALLEDCECKFLKCKCECVSRENWYKRYCY
jgi:hypothetical protein